MHSIRNFLVISILTLMTVSYAITAYWNYDETLSDIHHLFDEQLIEYNMHFQQTSLSEFENLHKLSRGKHSVHRAYQLWNTQGELLYRSADATSFPLSNHKPGLHTFKIGEHTWHTYTSTPSDKNFIYITAQRADMRNALAHELAIRQIIPFLITFPIVALACWLLIAHGFKPLITVTQQLDARQFDNLEPISTGPVPIEIAPTVNALNALFARLNAAYEREQRFTADAAHELRTPLAGIRTMAQLALGYKDIKSCHACLQDVLIGVDRCTHVVKQLAVLNSIRPEEILHDVTPLDINQVIKQISNELKIMADNKNIEVGHYFPAPCLIKANLASMQILFRNLIDNAIRYSPEGSRVRITTETRNHEAIIRVTDQGPGIPDTLRQRVFERFYRQLGTEQTGTGLGLSIVSTICALHEAKIELEDGDKGGLTVVLRFNVA